VEGRRDVRVPDQPERLLLLVQARRRVARAHELVHRVVWPAVPHLNRRAARSRPARAHPGERVLVEPGARELDRRVRRHVAGDDSPCGLASLGALALRLALPLVEESEQLVVMVAQQRHATVLADLRDDVLGVRAGAHHVTERPALVGVRGGLEHSVERLGVGVHVGEDRDDHRECRRGGRRLALICAFCSRPVRAAATSAR
jgi:hypothetical protein